ncbi:MAG: 1-acyl-sn-glycerol-3-phosphate acyltransferase [Gammaproteobacteria bacterium]|nr:MAG: 1-acyl-sn-glycerol-3-phosphate acyltransferase [Gammaproteobacteria bacterium]
MNTEVLVPFWLVVLLALLSVALLIDRLLIPSVRWFFRRRVNRVIDEVNTRLDIEIRPFQLTRRQALIDQLVFDERVNEAVQEYAREKDMPRAVAQAEVRRYAREIVPSFNAVIYFRLGYWLAKRIARLIYRIRVGFYDDDAMSRIDSNATVVFVMNHRSNMDYILVALLAAERTALSYAVGEWARIWPLTMLVKAMGAFFVRRNSGNPLYRRVLERYVHMATRAGVCQAVFIEGGLSKDGTMRDPRLGFLDYMLRGYHPKNDRDIVFIPVGINYDRVLEDRSQVRRLNSDAGRQSAWFIIKTTLRFAFRNMMLSRRVRWRRFGYACVNFGLPLSAKEYCMSHDMMPSEMEQEPRFVEVKKLANILMDRIRQVIPVLPVSLVAAVILEEAEAQKTRLLWMGKALERIEHFRNQGAPINISPTACERVLEGAMDILLGRGLLQQRDGLISVRPGSRDMLAYYANAIQHWQI